MSTKHFQRRGFHILADASKRFQPLDAICQFLYRGYQISLSTSGLSQGACPTEVAVFKGAADFKFELQVHQCHTVEEAIDWVNQHPL